jgi:hypothetical protein
MHRSFALPMLLAFALAAPLGSVAAGGTAEGKLTVDGKAFSLTHAYAILFKNEGVESYRLILVDVALTDHQQRLFPDIMVKEIKAGKVHGMGIGIKKSGEISSMDIYNSEGWPEVQEPNKKIQLKTSDNKTLAGRAYVDKPFRYVDGLMYQYDVKFSTPVRPESDFPL